MKKNWMNEFTRKFKRGDNELPSNDFNSLVEEFKKFSQLPYEQALLIAWFCSLRHKSSTVKIQELMNVINEKSTIENSHQHLEELIISGWLRYDAGLPYQGGHQLVMSNDAESALRNSKKECLPHKKLKTETRMIMEIYAKSILLRHNFIDAKTWHSKTKEWLKKDEFNFIKSLDKALLPNDSKSIALYIAVIFAFETQMLEINHVLKMFISDPLTLVSRKEEFLNKQNPLYTKQILEGETSPKGDLYIKPSDKWLSEWVPAKKIADSLPKLPSALIHIKHHEVKERKLYYNGEVKKQIDTIKELMMPKNFSKYIKKMKKEKENWGIIILLSGGPGTGKTELVRQIARESGRDMLYFDVSKQRNMYLGESEKAIHDVFSKYATVVAKVEQTPILFFNESDSVFHQRTSGESGISQTDNVVQTILLNELERFNGILICTTNRPDEMDKAFERRFTMHIKISEPNQIVRAQLLKYHFPGIAIDDMLRLSNEYAFTAANLETFKQQKLINSIISKKRATIENDLALFFQRLNSNGSKQNKIGFKYN
jgi:SpoVK/Ycf46/Vps4 family AAA+-type ATPase